MRYNAKLPVSNGNNGPARSYTWTHVLYNKIYHVHNILVYIRKKMTCDLCLNRTCIIVDVRIL